MHVGTLQRLFFMPHAGDPPHALRSWTATPDEISIVHGAADWFADWSRREQIASNAEAQVPIRIGDDEASPDFTEVGVVATHANVLRAAGVPTIYFCSFLKPLLLVPEELLQRAVAAFREAGAEVRCSDAWSSSACASPASPPAARRDELGPP